MANENDWGDGVLNNTIGWGQGSDNNTIGWGSVYGDSEAGLTALESAGGAPVNTLAPVISGTAERGETLTSNTGTWTGVGIITYAYQWKRDGSNISGAISSTYVLVIADDNTNITCLVTATDDVGSSSQLSNSLGPVLGSPYLLSAPVASGTAQVGETLSTTNGTWQGVATITFTYQWRRDAVNISGATSSTYVLVAADYTTDVDCVVTATNGLGSANQDTNDISNIAGTLPIISGVPTISAESQVGETITATAASVTGVPTPTTSWTWQRSADGSTGWADIIGATSITYTLVAADDANYVRAVQTETNASGSDSANSLASAQITPAVSYLLDTYGGASAAYSVFQLSSTATNCLRVRRSSDNAEQDIGFVSDTLDTASLLTFVGANDGFVTTYYDQSGNSSNFTQSSASNQPMIVNAGVVVTSGGVPAVKFNGINEYLSNTVDLFGEARLDQFFLTDTDGDTAYIFPNSSISSYYGMIAYSGNTSTTTTSPSYGSPSLYQNGVPINVTNRNTVYNDTNGRKVISHIDAVTSIWPEYRFGFWSAGILNFGGSMSALVAYTSDQSANRVGIETILDSLYNP